MTRHVTSCFGHWCFHLQSNELSTARDGVGAQGALAFWGFDLTGLRAGFCVCFN